MNQSDPLFNKIMPVFYLTWVLSMHILQSLGCIGFMTLTKGGPKDRNCSIHIKRANMHCLFIKHASSLDTGSTSIKGQKLECFKQMPKNIIIRTM